MTDEKYSKLKQKALCELNSNGSSDEEGGGTNFADRRRGSSREASAEAGAYIKVDQNL